MKKNMKLITLMMVMLALAFAGIAGAVEVKVSENIAHSMTWTSDNVYNLQDQIFVLPGATLTIEAGTLVQSTANIGGSLAVCRGARIFVNGTEDKPVIMTSDNDDLENWHEGCNEWGNLTVMGDALISASHYGGAPVDDNTKTPTGENEKLMEGLTDETHGMYGGDNDNDDSGSISYLSLRYGGKVIGLANELNGLSLGGIGRATDIHHVEIMNNVDDGIEIWGGTVCLKYVSIWNVGDDSFDVDQGWRGKAQFGLIVQGYSTDASQGSGVGDNCFETDGAEDSDAQPVTTAAIYNFTVVGQPIDGDGGTTWRDNARVQYRNCIFMDLGEKLVRADGDDGDGAQGYGYNGTLSWADTWTTSYDTYSTVNAGDWATGDFNDPAVMYTAQSSGNLAEMRGCVFYNNLHADAYTESDARGVTSSGGSTAENEVTPDMPIMSLTRGFTVEKGGKTMIPVEHIIPCAANAATTSSKRVAVPAGDSFFRTADYIGGFSADENWLMGWTAASDYGMTSKPEEKVYDNITGSVTWTANKVYNLQDQIFVLPGATLTIEAGTLVQSTTGLGGSLAVCRGAKIYVNGTEDKPVIMTSDRDDLKRWHEGCNEWGNLTIMGSALISASHYGGAQVGDNTKTPGDNEKLMEGLTDETHGMYGGTDDNDNSGSISYLSLRYGGKVIGLANELNGLSLGGIGRATDIHHVEIMNNVDDGIEIWGGTVGLKYVSIWNVGDDSFDVDQGWRGMAQHGLIVQGYSTDAGQGSGVGDNCFETDGAEDSDAQPVTTAAIYNFTVVGQPIDGDGGTAWRDNARVQYRNCIFMELGEKLVRADGDDGDGANGYGYNGTLSWEDTWTTDYTASSTINAGTWGGDTYDDPDVMYTVQKSGKLSEIRGSVFYNNPHADAYTEFNALGLDAAEYQNETTLIAPIQHIERGEPVVKGGKTMLPVTHIIPCAAHAALTTYTTMAKHPYFFDEAPYRGGFSQHDNWLMGWTAASDYGMTSEGREIKISGDITQSTIWTSNNVYNLQNQIYVMPGASLTIEPGTLIRSDANIGGSLAVCRGAKIYVNGEEGAPVVMTSTKDNLVQWHEGCNEWGNLTVMGDALISASHYDGAPVGSNTKTPGDNEKQMEGLTRDTVSMYGGMNDNDDSGVIKYLSLRYGGKVIALQNELNGLSLGGIGRGTDIHHVEVMNNVDDGIEIWGGTVSLKYVNIWNVGDDSFDIDQGWRGKAQFGLIVQGFSTDASQGSGVGDNCFETDGAEDSDAQPVTTAAIYNFTVVGQPVHGDGGTTWRDNARVQYRNCIFMDLGEKLVRADGDDGDGANGYGYNGTLSWADTWTTSYDTYSTVNAGSDPGAWDDPEVMYTAQTDGYLAEIRDCVFFNNNHADAYTEAIARGVMAPAMNNVQATVSPIRDLERGPAVSRGGKTMVPVTYINPLPANDAMMSVGQAPNDGFFTPVKVRGGFVGETNWLVDWTAVDSYGMTYRPIPASTGSWELYR